MSLELKKLNMIQLILSLEDEKTIDEISSKIVQLVPDNMTESDLLLSRYAGVIEEKLDLEKIIKEQNFKGIDKQKMDQFAKEANIQEPIDDLLDSIKN